MPRPIPSTFTNQDTYGVETNPNSDRLPQIDQNYRLSYKGIIAGPRLVPIRICLLALGGATESEEVAKLVIGALLCGSHTPPSAAKVTEPDTTNYSAHLVDWFQSIMTGERSEEEIPEDERVLGGPTTRATTSSQDLTIPPQALPDWVHDIEFDHSLAKDILQFDDSEVVAYSAVLGLAIGKQPTAQNLESFNQKRQHAVMSYLTKENVGIFIDDSPYLTLEILSKVHRTFNPIIEDRSLIMSTIVDRDQDLVSGLKRSFYTIFRLSAGASLNPLLIITRYARKYPTYYSKFPELETEYHAAAKALARFFDAPEKRRMYLKVIFGNAYVPVNPRDINSLLGCAVFALQQSEPSLANYAGGTITVEHRNRLVSLLNITEDREEEIPEQPVSQ